MIGKNGKRLHPEEIVDKLKHFLFSFEDPELEPELEEPYDRLGKLKYVILMVLPALGSNASPRTRTEGSSSTACGWRSTSKTSSRPSARRRKSSSSTASKATSKNISTSSTASSMATSPNAGSTSTPKTYLFA
jgi:hypothetical protein